MIPYTAIAEIASVNNTPIDGSASCTRVVCPNHVTSPPLSPRKSPPSGMMENERNAGTNARNGAILKTNGSARSGTKSSLKNNLIPSARVCSNPKGPALFGPIRLPIPATTLRSNHTMSMVATRPVTNTTKTFSTTMSNGVHRRSPFSTGSMASKEIMQVSQFAHQRCLHVHRKSREHHCQVG